MIGAVVAAEDRQATIAKLPDPGDGRVEECPVVRSDQERAATPAEVLLDPLEGGDVEVVGRLVEEQEVGIGDHESGQGGAGLFPAGQRGRRLSPLIPAEPEARQRLVDALIERVAAEDLELVLEMGVGGLLDAVVALEVGERLGHPVEVRGALADRGPKVRRGHELVVEMRLLGKQPERQPALPMDLAGVGFVAAGGQPHQRRLAGPVRSDEADPIADRDRGGDRVEDDERPDLAMDAGQPEDGHR